jgi:hypothetical protein
MEILVLPPGGDDPARALIGQRLIARDLYFYHTLLSEHPAVRGIIALPRTFTSPPATMPLLISLLWEMDPIIQLSSGVL